MSNSTTEARYAFMRAITQDLSAIMSSKGWPARENGLAVFELEGLQLYVLPVDLSKLPVDHHGAIPTMAFSLLLPTGFVGNYLISADLHGDHVHAIVKDTAGETAHHFSAQFSTEQPSPDSADLFRMTNLLSFPNPLSPDSTQYIANGILNWKGRRFQLGFLIR